MTKLPSPFNKPLPDYARRITHRSAGRDEGLLMFSMVFGLRVILVEFVPHGWRRSLHCILLTQDELFSIARGTVPPAVVESL
jgi:hypothetical protein